MAGKRNFSPFRDTLDHPLSVAFKGRDGAYVQAVVAFAFESKVFGHAQVFCRTIDTPEYRRDRRRCGATQGSSFFDWAGGHDKCGDLKQIGQCEPTLPKCSTRPRHIG